MHVVEKSGEFEAVYNRHKAGIYNFCCRMLNDGDEAKDVVQEVFIRFFESPARFDGEIRVREILILREWEELSYEEIAQALDTTVSAVKSKLFKARRQAAAIYKKLYGD